LLYHLLTDSLVLAHFGFIAFVVVGGFLAWRWRWLVWLHLPAVVWGALIEFAGWICPLTPWEVALRRAAGQAGYEGGFMEHYLIPIIYPGALTRTIQVGLGTLVVGINLLAYAGWVRHGRRRA
jgi:hypothetical protein